MNIARWLLRIAAVVSSLALASLYVYDRAGGTFFRDLISGPRSSSGNERQPPVLFGSEAAPTLTTPKEWEHAILPTERAQVTMSGSKSSLVFTGPPGTEATNDSDILLSGPEQSPFTNTATSRPRNADVPVAQPVMPTQSGVQSANRPLVTMLPGSKSVPFLMTVEGSKQSVAPTPQTIVLPQPSAIIQQAGSAVSRPQYADEPPPVLPEPTQQALPSSFRPSANARPDLKSTATEIRSQWFGPRPTNPAQSQPQYAPASPQPYRQPITTMPGPKSGQIFSPSEQQSVAAPTATKSIVTTMPGPKSAPVFSPPEQQPSVNRYASAPPTTKAPITTMPGPKSAPVFSASPEQQRANSPAQLPGQGAKVNPPNPSSEHVMPTGNEPATNRPYYPPVIKWQSTSPPRSAPAPQQAAPIQGQRGNLRNSSADKGSGIRIGDIP